MQDAHFEALQSKHATLDRRIQDESLRPLPDQAVLRDLKRRKLRVKEEMTAG
ncbi:MULTISPECIES: YdcH family protein [unclassified Sphingomonas]|jgi:hypothetical protein|uniref:YdcH family protein n=1 Tax=unclassified Sphingomonas TaxID=196159 RepID=UPI0009E8A67A|nr:MULTISPECIES: YdcH family protein [unclassified Sphingomonas]MCH4892710.1 DUF465 domain-containing protein [Sphingomonas sp. SFZ2018-12]